MENPRSEEQNIIEDVRNLFRLKQNKMTQQLRIKEIFLDQKKKIKEIKIQYLEILSTKKIRGIPMENQKETPMKICRVTPYNWK